MRFVAITIVATLGLAGSTQAANYAVITSPPTIMNLLVMLLAIAGLVIGYQLLQSTKGGLLGKAWNIFMAAFGILVLGQLSVLLQSFEFVSLPNWVSPGLLVIFAATFFYGLFESKRILA